MRYRKSRTVSVLKVLSIFLLLALVFGVVMLRSNVTSLEYTLSKLEKAKLEAQRDQKSLVAQKAGLMTLTRVEKTDLSDMGFSFPERKRVVYVRGPETQGPYRASYTTN
jgi:predicted PurR-regulated permease PerM